MWTAILGEIRTVGRIGKRSPDERSDIRVKCLLRFPHVAALVRATCSFPLASRQTSNVLPAKTSNRPGLAYTIRPHANSTRDRH